MPRTSRPRARPVRTACPRAVRISRETRSRGTAANDLLQPEPVSALRGLLAGQAVGLAQRQGHRDAFDRLRGGKRYRYDRATVVDVVLRHRAGVATDRIGLVDRGAVDRAG